MEERPAADEGPAAKRGRFEEEAVEDAPAPAPPDDEFDYLPPGRHFVIGEPIENSQNVFPVKFHIEMMKGYSLECRRADIIQEIGVLRRMVHNCEGKGETVHVELMTQMPLFIKWIFTSASKFARAGPHFRRSDPYDFAMSIDLEYVMLIMEYADFLDCQPVLRALGAVVADRIRDQPPSVLLKLIKLQEDMTEEKKERLRLQLPVYWDQVIAYRNGVLEEAGAQNEPGPEEVENEAVAEREDEAAEPEEAEIPDEYDYVVEEDPDELYEVEYEGDDELSGEEAVERQ